MKLHSSRRRSIVVKIRRNRYSCIQFVTYVNLGGPVTRPEKMFTLLVCSACVPVSTVKIIVCSGFELTEIVKTECVAKFT